MHKELYARRRNLLLHSCDSLKICIVDRISLNDSNDQTEFFKREEKGASWIYEEKRAITITLIMIKYKNYCIENSERIASVII